MVVFSTVCWNICLCYIWTASAFCLFSHRLVPLCVTYHLPYASTKNLLKNVGFISQWPSPPPPGFFFLNFCCLQKFKLQFFSPKSTESVENIMPIFFFSCFTLCSRCEPANTLSIKRFREVCSWIYCLLIDKLFAPKFWLLLKCIWSFQTLFYVFFFPPKFYRCSWRDQSKH